VNSKKVEWLSWRGYTERKRISLAGWTEGFSMPARFLEKVPYCIESYEFLREMDFDKRIESQRYMLDSTDHSVMGSIYMGVMRPREMEWLQDQLTKCLKTALRLIQITTTDGINGIELTRVLKELPAETSNYLRSALETSLYFYANGTHSQPFKNILEQPFYMETGIDILTNGLQFMLAEFQVRYATPYPHLLEEMNDAYRTVVPELFEKFHIKPETFAQRRLQLMSDCMDQFSSQAAEPAERLILDAWAYLNNRGASWMSLVPQLKSEYVLFDDLLKSGNEHEKNYRNKRLAIFNQPPLNLVDPDDSLFANVNSEKLETYDELCWVGLLERYLNNQVFIANSPLSDLINDKALYTVWPELSRTFFGEEIVLPIVQSLPCWDIDDHKKPHAANLERARNEKDDFVIAHRYLEGGMGIRVGHVTSAEEWDDFIDTFVLDRPYLYVLRERFEMDPDMSVRVLAATVLPKHTSDVATEMKCELMDTLYARLTTKPPLSADNHRSFLIYKAAADAPEPSYQFEETSIR